ncbi:CHASE2 domain-containing protein [Heliobacterium undosum]|uniref:CHASE2 domain-containing protein n=1 Tax=Heliomicrobium undosum TaxID=121734 RepID=A0A845L424_9FIRM|nr:adenylate/guanylate cyclase domain-containing protein [Heliomicrobium undosum]MZP29370.1 CHASE2 domain-containing protein [Heliomicrobium undosum]
MKAPKGVSGHLIALGLTMLMLLTAVAGLWEPLEAMAYDMWLRTRGVQVTSGNVVIIGIDDASISKIGRWPWNREIHARLLERLREAKVVTFDFTLANEADPQGDARLAEAIGRHGRVVLPVFFTFEKEGDDTYQVMRFPLPAFRKNAFSMGFVNYPTEADNIVRRTMPVTVDKNRTIPSLALASVMAAQGLGPTKATLAPDGTVQAGDLIIPTEKNKTPLLNFAGPAQSFPTYSYHQVLDGALPPEAFAGKVIFVGTTSPLLGDIYNTPFTRSNLVLGGNLPTPGVELHATAVDTFLNRSYYYRAPEGLNLFLLAFFSAASYTVALSLKGRPWRSLAAQIVLTAGWIAINGLVLIRGHYWINLVAPLIAGSVTYLAATVYNFILEQQERQKVKGLFGRYVSPAVVNELLAHPESIQLGGQRIDTTILFSDIRGFTAYSEGRSPEEVVSRLNEYFTRMTGIIFKHGGTLDKYMGDGIMAVFGAPIADPDHARHALEASKEMCDALVEMNALWKERGEPLFDLGVGLNSGPVLAGNIGSEERMDYTVIGEDVNLASRLESMNKQFKSRIIVSERTLRYLAPGETMPEQLDQLGLQEIGEVAVRGLIHPVKIYTLPTYNGERAV